MPKQNDLPTPVTANQKFLAKAAGMNVDLPTAITMDQMYLQAIAEGSGGGSGDSYTKAETDALLDGKADIVDGKVPASELPSYVDDTVEGYYYQGAFYEDSEHTITITGETGKIYIDLTTNKSYRWTGTVYVRIDECPAFGETQGTIYEGNKGKQNADAIAAIKDGTNIDSFADVETALALKANTADIGTAATADTTTSITSGGTGLPTSGAVYTDQQRQDAEIGSLTAATAVLVDKGAKNLVIDFGQIEHNGCIFTYGSDGRITVSGTKSTALAMAEFISNQNLSNYGLSAGDKIVAVSDNENVGVSIIFAYDQGKQDPAISVYNETRTITIPSGRTKWYLRLEIKSSIRGTINESIKPMVCDKKLYDIDPTVTPYVPTNRELYEMILALQNAQNGG